MINLWEMLKASKGLPPSDLKTMLYARKLSRKAAGSSLATLTANGYPCVLNGSVGLPAVDYKIYGNTIQDGTTSPENPVGVKSVGELVTDGKYAGKYKIPVVASGKNLFPPQSVDSWGAGYVTATGTTGRQDAVRGEYCSDFIKFRYSGRYALAYYGYTLQNNETPWCAIAFYDSNRNFIIRHSEYTNHVTSYIPAETAFIRVSARFFEEPALNNIKFQIELSSEYTAYEPYHTPITTNIYLDEPLKTGDILKYPENIIAHSDGTTEPITLPQLPTLNGTTVITTDTEVKPSNIEVTYKGGKENV